MRPILYPYKLGSGSARAISDELTRRGHRAKRVRPDGNYRQFRNHFIINWGNSTPPNWHQITLEDNWFNGPEEVQVASNKLLAFQAFEAAGNVSIPDFTTDPAVADTWVEEGNIVVARHSLTGHSGAGISLHHPGDDFLPSEQRRAPLYVKYIKKVTEYRVHVFNGEVIDIQQKRKRQEVDNDEVNYQVRNHANGWVYCRSDVAATRSVSDNALAAVAALGLHFGAADIIWNAHQKQAYVLEVNSAPGLEGTTLVKYVDAIEELL